MEDIRILTEEKLYKDGEKTKNPQQNLQLLDELIKKRIKPNENDLKIDALASKSKNLHLKTGVTIFKDVKMLELYPKLYILSLYKRRKLLNKIKVKIISLLAM